MKNTRLAVSASVARQTESRLLTTLFNLPARRDGVRARVMRMRKLNRILCKYGRVYPIYPPCAGVTGVLT